MKKKPLLPLIIVLFGMQFMASSLLASEVNSVNKIIITDYGVLPNSGENCVPAILKAFDDCKNSEKVVLIFPSGRYDFYSDHSFQENYYELNTTDVNPKTCPILIKEMNNLVIDGLGSIFIFHGAMQPFTIDKSSNITIKNVSVDWDIPYGTESEILEVTEAYFDLKIDETKYPYSVESNKLFFLGEDWKELWGGVKWNDPMEFDRETLQVTQGTDDDLLGEDWDLNYTAEVVGDGVVRIFHNNNSLLKKGNYLVLRHGIRDHAGVLMVDSKDILLENINMYSNKGMSFLAQFTENITYRNVNIIPNIYKRKIISGHDDGFHHTNCKGQITAENCSFKGLMDDSFNAHGTCVKIVEKINDKKLVCKFMHHQSKGVIWGRPGEEVGFINRKNMETIGTGIVESFQSRDTIFFEITFVEDIPETILVDDALENLTWTPNVTVRDCYFGSHRARGILVSTPGKVLIENNVFESSGSAIVLPGDANGWYETGAVKDVTISNNIFKASCSTSYYQFSNAIISVHPEIPELDLTILPFHRNVQVLNNTFEVFDYPVFFALNTDGISFNNNIIKRSTQYQPRHKSKYTLTFDACRNIEVKGNKFVGDVLGKNIKLFRTDPSEIMLEAGQGFSIY